MVRPTSDNRTYLVSTNNLTQIQSYGWTSDTFGMLPEIARLFDINRESPTLELDLWSNLPAE